MAPIWVLSLVMASGRRDGLWMRRVAIAETRFPKMTGDGVGTLRSGALHEGA